jgi:protein-S-isoprenylcysteine O-methyltransferase Ste14
MPFRWIALAGFAGTIAISATYRYKARQAGHAIRRGDEPAGLKAGRLFIGLPLFLSILIVFSRPQLLAWADVALPTWLRSLGAGMTLAAIPAAWWVFRSIGRNVSETVLTKSDHQLVTIGPYRWIRHPLYATGSLLLFGIGLATASGLVLGLATIGVLGIRVFVVPIEERELRARFGEAYRDYSLRTGGLLPRLWKAPDGGPSVGVGS